MIFLEISRVFLPIFSNIFKSLEYVCCEVLQEQIVIVFLVLLLILLIYDVVDFSLFLIRRKENFFLLISWK